MRMTIVRQISAHLADVPDSGAVITLAVVLMYFYYEMLDRDQGF